jgi:hypothetical protein
MGVRRPPQRTLMELQALTARRTVISSQTFIASSLL